jgi:hypothetical protein
VQPHGRDALMIATAHRRVEVVAVLLSKGAPTDQQDVHGWTAFHYACSSGSVETAAMLLRAGCGAEATERQGRTGRMLAAEQGFEDVVRLVDGHLGRSLGRLRQDQAARRLTGSPPRLADAPNKHLHAATRPAASERGVEPGGARSPSRSDAIASTDSAMARHRQRHQLWDSQSPAPRSRRASQEVAQLDSEARRRGPPVASAASSPDRARPPDGDSTFSRTVWRLYGGAKGLVVWY